MQGGSCCPMGVVGLSPSSLVLAEPSCPCHAVPWDRGSPAASAPRVAQLWLRGTAGGVRGCTPCAWCRWFVWGQGCAPTSLRAQQWHRFPPAAPWPPQEVPEHPALQRGRGCPHQEGRGGTSATACAGLPWAQVCAGGCVVPRLTTPCLGALSSHPVPCQGLSRARWPCRAMPCQGLHLSSRWHHGTPGARPQVPPGPTTAPSHPTGASRPVLPRRHHTG